MTSRDSPCGGFRALVGGSSFCGCYERASEPSERFCYDCAQTRHSSSDRIFFLFDAGDGVRSPSVSPTPASRPRSPLSPPADHQLHHHVPGDARASFVRLTANSKRLLLCCLLLPLHCASIYCIFISSVHMSLYPGYSGLQDSKSSFL